MAKIIIGNVDNEHMAGDPAFKFNTKLRQTSSVVANRMIWLVEEGDIVVLPSPPSDAFIQYVQRNTGVDFSTVKFIYAEQNAINSPILTFEVLFSSGIIKSLEEICVGSRDFSLYPYFYDRSMAWLETHLKLESHATAFLLQGGGEIFNSKTEFRRLASSAGIPIATGQSCSSAYHLLAVVRDIQDETGIVMLKQDFNSGGDGNSIITNRADVTSVPGAQHVYKFTDKYSLNKIVDDLWASQTGGKNTNLVAEVYHPSKHIYFSDYEVTSKKVEYLTHGEMRMEPLWVGFNIPGSLPTGMTAKLIDGSTKLSLLTQSLGYVGMINYDAVFKEDGTPVFLEFNGRAGGTTHIHHVAKKLFGVDYMDTRHIITRNKVRCTHFYETLARLHDAGVLYDASTRIGLLVMTEDSERKGTMEYLIGALCVQDAKDIEAVVLDLVD